MKFDGTNLEAVLEEHVRWYNNDPDEHGEVRDEWRADFSGADLHGALLPNMPLYGANFRGANLSHADLTYCDLSRADMTGSNLHRARLEDANLQDTVGMPFYPMCCPDTGDFIAWKQAYFKRAGEEPNGRCIIKLLIPADAERTGDTKRECRATKVKVLEIQTIDGEVLVDRPSEDCAVSIKNPDTEYRVGETVSVPDISDRHYFNMDGNAYHYERGIFFFVNRREAVYYLSGGADENGNPIDNRAELAAWLVQRARELMPEEDL